MHKRGLCRHHAVSICLSRSCILSKRINTSSASFSPSGSHTIVFFPFQTVCGNIQTGTRNRGVECRWGRQKSRFSSNHPMSGFWIDDWSTISTVSTVDRAVVYSSQRARPYRPPHISESCLSQPAWMTMPKKTEQFNCTLLMR